MSFSYSGAGVNIALANAAKSSMSESLRASDPRVLNGLGSFASLFEASFPGYRRPVLVLKTEEPGTKQKLALQHGRIPSLCRDLVHHLINDILMMGALPLAVQDAIICGRLEPEIVARIVAEIATACREQGCNLVGGETSEQPGVVPAGTYVLTGSIVGVVDYDYIVDGSRIADGDVMLAVASNGLHTNGYSLVRALLDSHPELATRSVGEEPLLEVVLRPHRSYLEPMKALLREQGLHGMAHITGGGLEGNVRRVVPDGLTAVIDLLELRVPTVFRVLRRVGELDDDELLNTFNLGVGLVLVVAPTDENRVEHHLNGRGYECYRIGRVEAGAANQPVVLKGRLRW